MFHFQLTFHDAIAFSPALTAQGQFGYVRCCFLDVFPNGGLRYNAVAAEPVWPTSLDVLFTA